MVNKFEDFKSASPGGIREYYRGRLLSQLDISELAYVHLECSGVRIHVKNGVLSSSLYDLCQAVSASFNNVRTKQYVPLLGCFSILDQIGCAYALRESDCRFENGIKRALYDFGEIKDAERLKQLVTLRHGLFHNGSLVNKSRHGDTNVFFRMTTEGDELLVPPLKEWDGSYSDDLTEYVTKINLSHLYSRVQHVVESCKSKLLEGKIDFMVQSERELFYKYLFKTPLPTPQKMETAFGNLL
ncbi:hypothetical protein HU751_002720 [Pseudomonas sp. BW13M1]|uniref:Uncharacterized protein n=1 Tax=Pseudomonas peradeniyensis TaxID=2745488 RepID=A0A923K0R3_9PSED|nr:hypothetical protein [Pseudomonas peradeniyensis]MBV4503750.1 hypothetical protein [Pseudomonas peradeniyensis]